MKNHAEMEESFSENKTKDVKDLKKGEGSSTMTPWKKTIVMNNIPDEFSDKEINVAIAQAMFILIVRKNYKGLKDRIKEKAKP